MFIYILRIVIQFVGRSFFIYFLGAKYLGLNGLKILDAFPDLHDSYYRRLCWAYSLYKPLAQKDESKVKALMNLYKKTYEFIGIFIGIVGVLFTKSRKIAIIALSFRVDWYRKLVEQKNKKN
ncbi:hypothetical protein EfmJHP9_08740 [Enterococcus faecium]|nr:hypothetical protein EfmJHP9_08740 [Enterococcus faecium]